MRTEGLPVQGKQGGGIPKLPNSPASPAGRFSATFLKFRRTILPLLVFSSRLLYCTQAIALCDH